MAPEPLASILKLFGRRVSIADEVLKSTAVGRLACSSVPAVIEGSDATGSDPRALSTEGSAMLSVSVSVSVSVHARGSEKVDPPSGSDARVGIFSRLIAAGPADPGLEVGCWVSKIFYRSVNIHV